MEFDKLIAKFIWKCNGPRIVKAVSKYKIERLTPPAIKIYYKAMVIKTM